MMLTTVLGVLGVWEIAGAALMIGLFACLLHWFREGLSGGSDASRKDKGEKR